MTSVVVASFIPTDSILAKSAEKVAAPDIISVLQCYRQPDQRNC